MHLLIHYYDFLWYQDFYRLVLRMSIIAECRKYSCQISDRKCHPMYLRKKLLVKNEIIKYAHINIRDDQCYFCFKNVFKQ